MMCTNTGTLSRHFRWDTGFTVQQNISLITSTDSAAIFYSGINSLYDKRVSIREFRFYVTNHKKSPP